MRLARVVGVLVLLLAAAGFLGVHLFQRALTTPLDPSGSERELLVPKGATLTQVGHLLKENKLLADDRVLRVYVKLNKQTPSPKAGRHLVSPAMSPLELLATLAQNPIPEDVPFTFVEGWRLQEAEEALLEKKLIEPGEYSKAAEDAAAFKVPFPIEGHSLFGFLLPETYMIPPGKLDVKALIQRQLDAFHERFYKPNEAEIQKSGRSLTQIVIMASILEREETDPKIRPQVAGVLYHRLDKNTPLGADATSHFTLVDWKDRPGLLAKLRDPSDPYNTRLKTGLPPGAIGAPGLASLEAALHPVRSEYWYYLHDGNGQIHFAKTADEHENNRKKYGVF